MAASASTSSTHPVPHAGTGTASRLISIDALRGIAALGVLLTHIPHMPNGALNEHAFAIPGLILDYGRLGVPLFIVLSGFCIHRATRRSWLPDSSKPLSWQRFFLRRIERLYVPYFAAIVLGLSVLWIVKGWAQFTSRFPWDVSLHTLMLHNLFVYDPHGVGNGPLWTIGLEFQLYLLYPVVYLLTRRIGWLPTLTLQFLLSLMWSLFAPWQMWTLPGGVPLTLGGPATWAFQYWFIWSLGAYCAEAVEHGPLPSRRVLLPACLLFAGVGLSADFRVLFIARHSQALVAISAPWTGFLDAAPAGLQTFLYITGFGCTFTLLLLLAIATEDRCVHGSLAPFHLAASLGLISYSLYLTHMPVLSVIHTAIPIERGPESAIPWILGYCVEVPLCLAVAIMFFFLIERHFLHGRLLARLRSGRVAEAPNPSLPSPLTTPAATIVGIDQTASSRIHPAALSKPQPDVSGRSKVDTPAYPNN